MQFTVGATTSNFLESLLVPLQQVLANSPTFIKKAKSVFPQCQFFFFFLFFRLWRNKKFKKLRLTVGLFMQTLVSHIKVDGLLTQPLPRSFHLFLLALLHERFTCYVPGIDIGIGHWRFVKYQCNWVALRNDFFRTKVIALPPCIICLT